MANGQRLTANSTHGIRPVALHALAARVAEQVCDLCGRPTGVASIPTRDGQLCLNCGSVAMPREIRAAMARGTA